MYKNFIFSSFLFLFLFAACNTPSEQNTENAQSEMEIIPAIELDNMDTTIDPGENFFLYVNGGWIRKNPIPDDKTAYSAFNVLADKNDKALRGIIADAAADSSAAMGSIKQKLGDFYSSGMDTLNINKQGIAPLQKQFDMISQITDSEGVRKTIARLMKQGEFSLFYFFSQADKKNSGQKIATIWQAGLGLPDRDYYFNTDERTTEIRDKYVAHVSKMFSLMGDDDATAAKNAKTIMKMETRLAKASNTRLENRDPQATYNKNDLAGLNKLTPDFNWTNFFAEIGYPDVNEIDVAQPKFLKHMGTMFKTVSVADWKTFLRWNIINHYAGYLSSDFETQNFEFYNKFLSGQKTMQERWKRITQITSGALGEAIGKLYVEKYFPPAAKERMDKLVQNLKKALHKRISNLVWMSDETKKEALAKLDKMIVKIGYPDKWIDYSSMEISRESFLQNVINANSFEIKLDWDKIGKPVDRTEWGMTPQTINAYYNPSVNEIVFPAGILHPPFFNLNADDAINYGAIGVVIGHEMTHGFDDQGRQFDKEGNMRDWWTEKDSKDFVKRVQLITNQYNNFFIDDSLHVNGELTLGENIADFGGLVVAYEAYQMSLEGKEKPASIDGFTDAQRFFISYGQVWRRIVREKALKRQLKEDVHSPGRFRVNGAPFNLPEFYEAFDMITPKSKLYRTEEQRPVIW